MTSLTVRYFLVCALLISVVGCIWSLPLALLGFLIVPYWRADIQKFRISNII
ncbi:MAG: hypothetical protein IJS08_00440 [Victivallales bacterium]|nr:hypothetical protein [Victivallales bacterium]